MAAGLLNPQIGYEKMNLVMLTHLSTRWSSRSGIVGTLLTPKGACLISAALGKTRTVAMTGWEGRCSTETSSGVFAMGLWKSSVFHVSVVVSSPHSLDVWADVLKLVE